MIQTSTHTYENYEFFFFLNELRRHTDYEWMGEREEREKKCGDLILANRFKTCKHRENCVNYVVKLFAND